MNELQRKRQMQAVHAQFKRMVADGTITALQPNCVYCHRPAERDADGWCLTCGCVGPGEVRDPKYFWPNTTVEIESPYLWASGVLGRVISTLTACRDFELNALRDMLNGKPPKIHARLRDVLSKTKKNPDQWVNWMMHNAPKFERYREQSTHYTVETLPLVEAYRLLIQEEPRAGGYRKSEWTPLKQQRSAKGAQKVASEQRTLWGM